jgi:hypothetical protein
MPQATHEPQTHKESPSKAITCKQYACKKTSPDVEAATKEGWYMDPQGVWYCYQHNPNTIRTN